MFIWGVSRAAARAYTLRLPPLSSKSKKPAVLTDSGKLNKTAYYAEAWRSKGFRIPQSSHNALGHCKQNTRCCLIFARLPVLLSALYGGGS